MDGRPHRWLGDGRLILTQLTVKIAARGLISRLRACVLTADLSA